MARVAPQQIGGLQFAIDRKTVDSVVAVDGKNFLVDLDGPRSAFAHQLSARATLFNTLPESFTVGLETFHFLRNAVTNEYGVFKNNWAKKQWEILFAVAINPLYITYKTTHALVGGKQYFANRGVGVWERNPTTNVWTDVTANFPNNTFFITESAGRCISLAEGVVAWSAIDDANDFTPSTTTGAGFQSLSLIGTPENDFDYRGLEKVADGFLVFMRQGILKSTSIDSVIQFRHRVVKDKLIALNGWSFARVDDDALIFLTARGLYITNGSEYEIWQPLLSEELRLKIIPNLIADINGQIQLHYSKEKDWFFVSITNDSSSRIFEYAIVSYLPRGEWGYFNELHRGFIDIDALGDGSGFQQDQLAYMSVNSEVSLFKEGVAHIETAATADTSASSLQNSIFYSDELYDIPNHNEIANCNMRMSALNHIHENLSSENNPLPTVPSYYEINGLDENPIDDKVALPAFKASTEAMGVAQLTQTRTEVLQYGFIRQVFELRSLDCNMTIGLIRLTDEQSSDQFSLISNVAISMTDSAGSSTSTEDWLNDFNPDLVIDWLNDFPTEEVEDYGINVASASSYKATIITSLDGYADFAADEQELDLALEEGRTRFYSTDRQGLYVMIKLDGSEVNDYIHLRKLELTGILSGRL